MFTETFKTEFANQIAAIVIDRLRRVLRPTVAQRYLTVQQAAQYIGHTKSSFEYLISKDQFTVIRCDRLVAIDKDDLDKFMLQHKR